MSKITSAYSWTNMSFIDLEIEVNGIDYTWQGTMDGKLSTYEILCEGTPVEEESVFNGIQAIAFDYLHNTKDVNTGKSKITELLDNIYYEG